MRLATLAAFALFTAGTAPAATTFAAFTPYDGSKLVGGGGGGTTAVDFTYGGVNILLPYDSTMHNATLTYAWTPVARTLTAVGSTYYEDVTGDSTFAYQPLGSNLVTVGFSSVDARSGYSAGSSGPDLSLVLNPYTSGGSPGISSDILSFPALTDWAFIIDFGNENPGYANGNIKNFNYGFSSTVGFTPFPGEQIPEPASALMAGAGLLAVGGLLRLRKRFHK